MFRIIALSDFSANAHSALLVAMRLAQSYSGEIILTHAMERGPVPATAPPSVYSEVLKTEEKEFLEKLRVQAQSAFQELDIRRKEVLYRLEILPTPLVESAVELSEQLSASLIVMGNSGANGLERIIAGSSTLQMVERATRSLLIIPHGYTFRGFPHITLVIRPEHFKARAGSDLLFRFARTYSAKLDFVFLIEDDEKSPELLEFLTKYKLSEAQEFTCSTHAISGSEKLDALKKYLSQSSPDLIVAFPRSKNLWKGLFSNSITEEMISQGNIPVLVLPKHVSESSAEV